MLQWTFLSLNFLTFSFFISDEDTYIYTHQDGSIMARDMTSDTHTVIVNYTLLVSLRYKDDFVCLNSIQQTWHMHVYFLVKKHLNCYPLIVIVIFYWNESIMVLGMISNQVSNFSMQFLFSFFSDFCVMAGCRINWPILAEVAMGEFLISHLPV